MEDEVDSITYIQNTIVLLSNEVVEKRGELENTKKIIKDQKANYNKEFRDFNTMSKLISREEKLLEETDKKISKINLNMKLKIHQFNPDFVKNLNDFMSRTNQEVSNTIIEFLGFFNSSYSILKNILREDNEFASILENSISFHKNKFNTFRQLSQGADYAHYLINYKTKLEDLIKENKEWMDYPLNIIIDYILMEFDLFSLYLEREKILESIENLQNDKNNIFIGLKNLESEILKNDALFRNFSRYIKSINIIFEKYMFLKESSDNFSSYGFLQENIDKINEFAENLKEFKKSNFINLLRKYDNMNSLTLKSEYSEDITDISPDEITKAVNRSNYNPIHNNGYIKNSANDDNNNILDFNMDQANKLEFESEFIENDNEKDQIGGVDTIKKSFANQNNPINSSKYIDNNLMINSSEKECNSGKPNKFKSSNNEIMSNNANSNYQTNYNSDIENNKTKKNNQTNLKNKNTIDKNNHAYSHSIISKLKANSNTLEMKKKKNSINTNNKPKKTSENYNGQNKNIDQTNMVSQSNKKGSSSNMYNVNCSTPFNIEENKKIKQNYVSSPNEGNIINCLNSGNNNLNQTSDFRSSNENFGNLPKNINERLENFNIQQNLDENYKYNILNEDLKNKDVFIKEMNENLNLEVSNSQQGNCSYTNKIRNQRTEKLDIKNLNKNNLFIQNNCEHFESASDELITSPLNRIPVRTSKLISEKPTRAKSLKAVPDLFNLKIDKHDVKSVGGCCVSCV